MFKVISLLCFAATVSRGAMITGGTIVYSQNAPLSMSSGSSGFLALSDGVTVPANDIYDGPITVACYDYGSSLCSFSGVHQLSVGAQSTASGIYGMLTISYQYLYTASRGYGTQTFTTPFTSIAGLSNTPVTSCPFSDAEPSCILSAFGSGIATVTITSQPQNGTIDVQYISNETLVFAPEPASLLMSAISLAVLGWYRLYRNGYRYGTHIRLQVASPHSPPAPQTPAC